MRIINFVGYRKWWYMLSGVVIVAGMISFGVRGLNMGIDFKGGNLFEIEFEKTLTVHDIRSSLEKVGFGDVIIQQVSTADHYVIKTGILTKEEKAEVKDELQQLGVKKFLRDESVTPKFGQKLTWDAVKALGVSLVAILIYITIRFEFRIAVAAIIELIHDTLVFIGIYSISFREVTTSTVAAYLTILGYSLMDSIVIFDRIRENKNVLRKLPFEEVVNSSINQTLARSINTTLATLIPVICLLVIGGDTLKDFAFALTIGILSGAYSSIFNGSQIIVSWNRVSPKYKVSSK
jgi:preprotein translocase SecF subunit